MCVGYMHIICTGMCCILCVSILVCIMVVAGNFEWKLQAIRYIYGLQLPFEITGQYCVSLWWV